MAFLFRTFDPGAERVRRDFESEAYRFFREIYRAGLRMTRNPAEAEDLTQEVFLQAWKSFGRFERGTNCRAWLYKILWNVFQQKLRRRVPVPLGAEGEERVAETLAAVETTPTEVTDDDVRLALESVSAAHREIVLLSDVEGFTYKEIASILSVPIGTVMSRLSRARAALRAELLARGIAPKGSRERVREEGRA